MNSTDFVSSKDVDLSNCDREAIHIPGLIQPHGVLLVLQAPQLKILQASKNTKHFLGIAVQSLINQNLSVLFPKSQIALLEDCISQENPEIFNPLKLSLKYPHTFSHFTGIIHRIQKLFILEIEPLSTHKQSSELSFYHLIRNSVLKIKKASTFRETTRLIAQEVRRITGYDRVMIYRFEPDESGVIIAEDKQDKLESYLDLHYPASDIPKQARKLYYENWLRIIVDMHYQPVEIIPANNPITNAPIDLSFSLLRSVSPLHIEYCRNMGVYASMCVSLINDKTLWGLIVCHHQSPKYVDYETRKYCEFLGQLMSLELIHLQKKEAEEYREKIHLIQHKLNDKLLGKMDIRPILEQNRKNLLGLVKAEGAAVYWGNELTLLGQTPPEAEVHALRTWLLNLGQQDVFFTNSLSQLYPAAQKFTEQASGLLAISIFLNQTSYSLLWFRPEVIQTVNWGGDPNKPVSVENGSSLQLSPRRSFALWKETVREKSLPWQHVEIDAAVELRNTLMLAALEFSHSALKEAAERAEVANHAKSQFLAKMSHELRTPLNAILGFSRVMSRDSSLSSEQLEQLGIINRSGEHLLALINDVLEMSKIEAGRLTLNEYSFDLYQALDAIQEMLRFKANAKRLQLVFERAPEVPQYVVADESKLRQILINLLENAIKFTQQGRVMLRVGVENRKTGMVMEDKGDKEQAKKSQICALSRHSLIFAVEDTGPGIAPTELDAIFEAFVQTETGRQSMQGTGLGLPISRQFIRLMGGDITVSSQLGQGTTFTFDIPVCLADKTHVYAAHSTKRVIGLDSNQPRYCILVVEDVEENRKLLVTLLKSVGFEVQSAENGVEAVTCWQQWKPHLIWMDMLMPVMDGYEATKHIKATLQGQATVIIALTANAFSEERSAILAAGCDDFIPKPFQEDVLFEKIAHHLGVRYVYEEHELSPSQQTREEIESLTPEVLAVMSSSWVAQLHRAAEGCLDDELLTLIEQIPEQHGLLKVALTDLVNNFRFDIIINLTQASDHE